MTEITIRVGALELRLAATFTNVERGFSEDGDVAQIVSGFPEVLADVMEWVVDQVTRATVYLTTPRKGE